LILYSTSRYSVKQTRFRRPQLASASSFRHHCCLRSKVSVCVNVYCPLQRWRPSSNSRLAILWHRQTQWRGSPQRIGRISWKTTVTPRFPKGLISARASGQWRGADGEIVREDSHVFQLLYPDDATAEKAIRELVETYKTQFKQEAVMRIRSHTCASF
jgi:Protein of unknown function (DUF3574)